MKRLTEVCNSINQDAGNLDKFRTSMKKMWNIKRNFIISIYTFSNLAIESDFLLYLMLTLNIYLATRRFLDTIFRY